MNFQLFKRAVAEQFARMSQHALFRTTAPKAMCVGITCPPKTRFSA